MGRNLSGDDARAWELHCKGFSVTAISGMAGLSEAYVRGLICAVWREDKSAGKRKAA